MKLALDRDEEARAAGKTEPLLSDGSSASDSTSGGGGGGYGTLESGGDEELLGGSAPVVKPSAFEAYVADFFEAFPAGRVFVATESTEYAAVVRGAWRARWGAERVLMRDIGTRISGKRLNAMVYVDRQLDVLQDVFFDVQLMARCDYFLHSASAVSEAVIYSNLALHEASVHLEYQHDISRLRDAPWRRPPAMRRAPDGRRQYSRVSSSAVQ